MGLRDMHKNMFTFHNGDRPDAENIAIVLTDGKSTRLVNKTIPYAEEARADGIKIIVIGITNKVDLNEVRSMSSFPHEEERDYFLAMDFNSLGKIADDITDTTCGKSKGC